MAIRRRGGGGGGGGGVWWRCAENVKNQVGCRSYLAIASRAAILLTWRPVGAAAAAKVGTNAHPASYAASSCT